MTASRHVRSLRYAAIAVLLLLTLLVSVPVSVRAAGQDNPEIQQAIEWLAAQQAEDGGFSAFGGESDAGSTADVIFALVAAGMDPATVSANGISPIDYLRDSAEGLAGQPGLAGKVVLALVTAGHDPRDVNETDLIAVIANGANPDTGIYGQGTIDHAYAMLALVAAGEDVPGSAIEALLAAQHDDGAWSFTGGTEPGTGDSNSTALAIQALAAAGGEQAAMESGVDYILSLQDEQGAIAYDASGAPDLAGDANSTAVAIQAIIAAGGDASSHIEVLHSFRNESGAFFWRSDFADDSLLATAQAIPALLGMPLPIEGQSAAASGPGSAGLVIRHGDGSIVYALVPFDDGPINGLDLIERSGLDAAMAPFGGMGAAVCSLNGEGCPSDDCFCHSYSDPSFYWQYFIVQNGTWQSHPVGAASRELGDGDIDGWAWTSGDHGLPDTSIVDIHDIVSAIDPNAIEASEPAIAIVYEPGAEPESLPAIDDDGSGITAYVIAAGLAALVLAVGMVVVVRNRASSR